MTSDATPERLADVEDEAVVTVQMDLDPSTTPTRADARTRAHSLVDELRRSKVPDLSHEATRQFEQTVERVSARIEDPNDMGLPAGRRMGAVVFA